MASERLQRGEPIKKVKLKNGRVRYRVLFNVTDPVTGKRKQSCTTHDSLAEAREALARVRVEVKDGKYVTNSAVTFAECAETWLAGRRKVKKGTLYGYRSDLRPVMEALGDLPVQKITRGDVEALVTKRLTEGGRRGEGVSPRTVALMLTLTSAILTDAVRRKLVRVNVAEHVELPEPEEEFRGSAWTVDEARTFLAQIADDRLAAAWRLSLYGLRRGEVLGLSWDLIDLDAGRAVVRDTRRAIGGEILTSSTKNRKERVVPLGPEVVAALRTLRKTQAQERLAAGEAYENTGLVVVNELGTPVRPERYSDLFHTHREAAGLPRIRLHDLRHTAASLLAENGVPIITAASLLGHDPMVFAKTYAHVYDEGLTEASMTLSGLYQAQ